MGNNILSDETLESEIIDYISNTAEIIDAYKDQLKLASDYKQVLEDKINKLSKELVESNNKIANISLQKVASSSYLIPEDEAKIIADNLNALGLIKQSSINECSKNLTQNSKLVTNVINTLIEKVASSSSFAQGKPMHFVENNSTKQLNEFELLERQALGLK